MEIIRYLGEQLAKKINISPPAARGLLKLSIKDELGPFIALDKISYNELSKVLHNSLKKRLINLKISNYEEIVIFMTRELELNQSLITMAGVYL